MLLPPIVCGYVRNSKIVTYYILRFFFSPPSFFLSFSPFSPNSIFAKREWLSKLCLLLTLRSLGSFRGCDRKLVYIFHATNPGVRSKDSPLLLRATFPARSDSKASSTAQSRFLLPACWRRLSRDQTTAGISGHFLVCWSALCWSVCVKFALILFPPFIIAIGFETVTRCRWFLLGCGCMHCWRIDGGGMGVGGGDGGLEGAWLKRSRPFLLAADNLFALPSFWLVLYLTMRWCRYIFALTC